ncbi:MAG: hypothetical protein WAZ14_03395 [Patescibacteria group bacterium]
MTKKEVAAALASLDDLPNWSTRVLMVGVLASSKTLRGETNKWPNRYPNVFDIVGLFPPHRRTVNLIHYASDDYHTLPEQLDQLMDLGGRYLDGFQLNVTWPEPSRIDIGKRMRVVLQLNRKALEVHDNNPERVAKELDWYKPYITDVLIDASGGLGIPMDVEIAEAYVRAIGGRHTDLGIGVAGGLSHEGMKDIRPLAEKFPNLSLDAEGRLRTPAPEDRIDVDAMQSYISIADGLFDH